MDVEREVQRRRRTILPTFTVPRPRHLQIVSSVSSRVVNVLEIGGFRNGRSVVYGLQVAEEKARRKEVEEGRVTVGMSYNRVATGAPNVEKEAEAKGYALEADKKLNEKTSWFKSLLGGSEECVFISAIALFLLIRITFRLQCFRVPSS